MFLGKSFLERNDILFPQSLKMYSCPTVLLMALQYDFETKHADHVTTLLYHSRHNKCTILWTDKIAEGFGKDTGKNGNNVGQPNKHTYKQCVALQRRKHTQTETNM